MHESELKLDLPCPRCGTSNIPSAQRCRQCFHDIRDARPGAPTGGLFDWARPVVACEACGKANPFNAERCLECQAPMPDGNDLGGQALEDVEAEMGNPRLRKAVRERRRSGEPAYPGWLNVAWLIRLSAVLFLFWGVVSTGPWLTRSIQGLPPGDPAVLPYTSFAIYELVRNMCIAGGMWLLTMLHPRR